MSPTVCDIIAAVALGAWLLFPVALAVGWEIAARGSIKRR